MNSSCVHSHALFFIFSMYYCISCKLHSSSHPATHSFVHALKHSIAIWVLARTEKVVEGHIGKWQQEKGVDVWGCKQGSRQPPPGRLPVSWLTTLSDGLHSPALSLDVSVELALVETDV